MHNKNAKFIIPCIGKDIRVIEVYHLGTLRSASLSPRAKGAEILLSYLRVLLIVFTSLAPRS